MSRTIKDKRITLRIPDYYMGFEGIPGLLTKKRKSFNTNIHFMTTPSWWTRIRMNVPQRRAGRLWERKVVVTLVIDDTLDPAGVSGKPFIYFH